MTDTNDDTTRDASRDEEQPPTNPPADLDPADPEVAAEDNLPDHPAPGDPGWEVIGADFEYEDHDELPENVMLVRLPPSEYPDKAWVLERGVRPDGTSGLSVTDMEPEHDDPTVTQLEYVFVDEGGYYAHQHTGVHRHGDDGDPNGGHGECEQVPPAEEPTPGVVHEIALDADDLPVMSHAGEGIDSFNVEWEHPDAVDADDADGDGGGGGE